MGIVSLKGEPTPREPVTLINDESYNNAFEDLGFDVSCSPPWTGDLNVELQVDAGRELPAVGSQIFITTNLGEPPAVWGNEPRPHRLGVLIGTNADLVADFIHACNAGLGGTFAGRSTSAGIGMVLIPAPKSQV